MINRPTLRLRWDDLDAQGCAEDGSPDWNSMIVVGPTKVRDSRGNVSLHWSVTVQCTPPARTAPAPAVPATAAAEPALASSPLGSAA